MATSYQQLRAIAVTARNGSSLLRTRVANVNNSLVLVVIILVLIAQSGVGLI